MRWWLPWREHRKAAAAEVTDARAVLESSLESLAAADDQVSEIRRIQAENHLAPRIAAAFQARAADR